MTAIFNQDRHINWARNRSVKLTHLFNLNYNRDRLVEGLKRRNRLPPGYMQLIEDAYRLLEAIYPGRGDIQFELEPYFREHVNSYGYNAISTFNLFEKLIIKKVFLIVHFPEFIITNSADDEHTIKDLYVRIPIEFNNYEEQEIYFCTVQGTRSTVSPAEVDSIYQHSHLQGVDMRSGFDMGFEDFCTGSGDINVTTAELNADYSAETLELLLLQLDTFVRWESLEGTPYRHISNVANKAYGIPDALMSTMRDIYRECRYNIKRYKVFPELEWRFQDGQYSIVDNIQLETFFVSLLRSHIGNDDLFFYKDERGDYFRSRPIAQRLFTDSENWIPFRGNKVRFKVVGEYRQPTRVIKCIHPKIKNYVKQFLEQYANNAKIRESALNE